MVYERFCSENVHCKVKFKGIDDKEREAIPVIRSSMINAMDDKRELIPDENM